MSMLMLMLMLLPMRKVPPIRSSMLEAELDLGSTFKDSKERREPPRELGTDSCSLATAFRLRRQWRSFDEPAPLASLGSRRS